MPAGRPRLPSALKAAKGTDEAARRNDSEPEFALLDDLEPPATLDEGAAAVWRQVAPKLRRAGVLTEVDVIALEMLCDAVALYRVSRQQLGQDLTHETPKGAQTVSPWLIAMQMTGKRAEAFMAKFGLDPVSRSRVMVDPQADLFGKPQAPHGAERFFSH